MWKVITPSIAVIGSVFLWLLNKSQERKHEEYLRKEKRYETLIKKLSGFYVGSESKQQKDDFIKEGNLCWLYCPDEVIQKIYNFLSKVKVGEVNTDAEKEIAVGDLILAIRKDLISRKIVKQTNLKAKDFQNLSATDPSN